MNAPVGDGAFEVGVFSFVDHPHPTTAEVFEDPVVGDSLADHLEPTRTCKIPAAQRSNGTAE